MIGIIGAMEVEIKKLTELMKGYKTEIVSTVKYYAGKINDVEAVVACAGVGKVNAAVSAQTMILKYNPDVIINVGVAGGLAEGLKIGDIAVADAVCEHDMDTTPCGDEKGFITGINRVYMKTDEKISRLMYEAAKKLGVGVIKGVIASGDQFIASENQKDRIIEEFNAVAAEMEGASIGHVCTMANKPFAVLRAISDGANDGSVKDFPAFVEMAAENSAEVILDMLEMIRKEEEQA